MSYKSFLAQTVVLVGTTISTISLAVAQGQSFSPDDLAKIAETSRSNEMRFNRDFKDHPFSGVLPVRTISENMISKGQFRITLGAGNFGNGVDCKVIDKATIDKMVDWNKGDRVKVSGIITGTSMGDTQLDNCTYQFIGK